MTQYTKKSFSVNMAKNDAYRDNFDRIFRGEPTSEPSPSQEAPVLEASAPVAESTVWAPCYVCGRGHFCPGERK